MPVSASKATGGDFPRSSYSQFIPAQIALGHTLNIFAKLVNANARKLLEAGPPASQLSGGSASPAAEGLNPPVERQEGSKHSLCGIRRRGGLRKFGRQIIQNRKQCKNRLGNYCAVTINEAIESINHSPASEACCERRIRGFYVPSTRKPQGPGA